MWALFQYRYSTIEETSRSLIYLQNMFWFLVTIPLLLISFVITNQKKWISSSRYRLNLVLFNFECISFLIQYFIKFIYLNNSIWIYTQLGFYMLRFCDRFSTWSIVSEALYSSVSKKHALKTLQSVRFLPRHYIPAICALNIITSISVTAVWSRILFQLHGALLVESQTLRNYAIH